MFIRNMYCLTYRALQSSRLCDITYSTFLSVISAETLLFRRVDKVILPVSNFSGGFTKKWVACYCIMQNSTRYQNAALGVDFQMLRHNIIVDIIRWSIPEKKKYNFPSVPAVSTTTTRRLPKFPDVARQPNTLSRVLICRI
jgi:hypothetical protein